MGAHATRSNKIWNPIVEVFLKKKIEIIQSKISHHKKK